MHPRRRAVLSPEPAPTTPGVGASGRAGGSRQPPAPSLPRRGTRVSSGRLRPVSSYCSVSFFVLFCFFFFEATPLEYDRLGFLALPDCFLCVCWVFCFFSLFCGCPKKVCILSRFLNPFSTREITGKDVESFLLVLCVKGGLVNPELFFILKKKSEINSRGRGFAFAQKRGASALCCLERCLKTTEK